MPMSREIFETKIAIVLEEGLQSWQKLNVSAFLGSSIIVREVINKFMRFSKIWNLDLNVIGTSINKFATMMMATPLWKWPV